MPERLTEARRGYPVPSQSVGFPARHACANALAGGPLGILHDPMDLSLPRVGPRPHHYRAGEVGTIALELGPEVEEQELALPDGPGSSPGVG